MVFVCTLDVILELAPIVGKLFGHLVNPAWHVATDCGREGHALTDMKFMQGHRAPLFVDQHQFGTSMPQGGHPPHHSITSSARKEHYLGFASTRWMVATRLSNSIGLASNSSHPVAMAVSRSLSPACADMPMIGMSRVCGSFLRRRTASQRSSSGISRSIRITSGCSLAAKLQPFSLSSAARTSKSPRSSRRVLSMYRLSSLCST